MDSLLRSFIFSVDNAPSPLGLIACSSFISLHISFSLSCFAYFLSFTFSKKYLPLSVIISVVVNGFFRNLPGRVKVIVFRNFGDSENLCGC